MSGVQTNRGSFFSLVPEGSPHEVEGEREVMLPGIAIEIYATRKIRLQRWTLKDLVDPYWRLYCPVEGKARVRLRGEEHVLVPGDLYLIPPRTAFSASLDEPFAKWYVHFIIGHSDLISVPGIYRQELGPRAAGLLERLESSPGQPYAWEAAALVVEALSGLPPGAWSDRKIDPRVERALEFLHANLARRITAADAAAAAGISVRNLNPLFNTQVRIGPMTMLLNYRLDRACHLLRQSDLSIEQVAEQCGFPNRYYFSRMLKQHRGISPAAYRKGQLY
jgi:AraC-like DNA-binding protein